MAFHEYGPTLRGNRSLTVAALIWGTAGVIGAATVRERFSVSLVKF